MHTALVTALGKHAGAKFVPIGTQPEDDRHWFVRTLAGGTQARSGNPMIQRASDEDDWEIDAPGF